MKQIYCFGFHKCKLFAIVSICVLHMLSVKAETVTYTITSSTEVSISGMPPMNSSVTFKNTYTTTKEQITKDKSQTLTLKGWGAVRITNITLSMKSNSSSGGGELTYSVDGTTENTIASGNFNNTSWNGSWSTSYVDVSKNVNIETIEGKDIVWQISCSKSSLYCESYTITYESMQFETVEWWCNGSRLEEQLVAHGNNAIAPAEPEVPGSCSGKVFVGWSEMSILGETNEQPENLFKEQSPNPIVGETTFYAVFAEETIQKTRQTKTLSYDTWTYIGTTTNKNTYRLFGKNAYVKTQEFDLSTLSEVSVKIATFGGSEYNTISIEDANGNVWGSVTASTSTLTTKDVTQTGSLAGRGELRIVSKSGNGTGNGVRMSEITYTALLPSSSYTNYVTTCDDSKVSVSYDAQGGEMECTSSTIDKENSYVVCNAVPTKTGYTFLGWNTQADGNGDDYAAGATMVNVTDNIRLYAQWGINNYTISFAPNTADAIGSMGDIIKPYNTVITLPENQYSHLGLEFAGWNTMPDGRGDSYKAGDSFTIPAENVTLYAQWAKLYTVTYVVNGISYVEQEYQYHAGDALVLPDNPSADMYACEDYTFVGWSTIQQANEIADKPALVAAGNAVNEHTTLYAVWSKVENVTDNYEKITSRIELSEGEYLIVGNSSNTYRALTATAGSTSGTFATKLLTPSNDVIVNADEAIVWSIRINGSTYAIYNASSAKYLNINSSGVLILGDSPVYYALSVSSGDFDFTANSKHLSYYHNNIVFNAYNSNNAYHVYLYKRVASYSYTTSPTCGPKIVAGEVNKLTSANGKSVRSLQGTLTGTRLTGTTVSATISGDNADYFSVTIVDPVVADDGTIHTTYTVVYTPAASDALHTATLTFSDGSTDLKTNIVTLSARSLPDEFAIVGNNGEWQVLRGDMTGTATNPAPISVSVTDGKVDRLPSLAVYSLDEIGADSSAVRLVGVGGRLWGSSSATTLNNKTGNAVSQTAWYLWTDDLEAYKVVNTTIGESSNERGLMIRYADAKAQWGHYATGNYTTKDYYGVIRFMPFEEACTRLEMGAVDVIARSNTAELSWTEVQGATGYRIECNNAIYTATGTSYVVSGLLSETDYACTITPIAEGTDCSVGTIVTFTTTSCDDVPTDLAFNSTVASITLTWTCISPTASVVLYADAECTDEVARKDNTASPCTIGGLSKATTYYAKVLAGGSCPSEMLEVHTEQPALDVVEWDTNKIVISLNTDDPVKVLLENQVTKGTGNGNIAEDLFFSKYYEATSNVKLLAIFNGTLDEVDLTKYRICIGTKDQNWTYQTIASTDFQAFGKTTLLPNEELILWYDGGSGANNYDDAIIRCVTENNKFDLENQAYECSKIIFSGRQNFLLEKTEDGGSTYRGIDLLGAMDANGACLEPKEGIEGACVPSWGDITNGHSDYRAWCGKGFSIDKYMEEGTEEEIDISTNRCLLIRRNTVVSGAYAMEHNVNGFYTLGGFEGVDGEWMGRQVDIGSDKGVNSSCLGFEYVGTYDYSGYYTAYDLLTTQAFSPDARNEDGTYTVKVSQLDTLSCRNLKIQVLSATEEAEALVTKEYRVPIIVNENATTAEKKFFDFGGDTCKTCDVVVRDRATLTKATDGTAGDKPEVRNVKVYQGARLEVPTGTTYTVNQLALRRQEDEVPTADLSGTLSTTQPVCLDVRVNAENWHWLTLPYECNISDVTFADGTEAIYNTDWFLMYYDGAQRAATRSSSWKVFEGTTLQAGVGYIVGIAGHPAHEKYAYELRFPMAGYNESTGKTVPVAAYGAGKTDLTPNHKGWNLVGNPYMDWYKKGNLNSFGGLTLGKLVQAGESLEWELDGSTVPYVTIPLEHGWKGYEQVTVAGKDLEPFVSYFVQVGTDSHQDAEALQVSFDVANRGRLGIIRRAPAVYTDEYDPVLVGVSLSNNQGECDATSLVIADRFVDTYEMSADMVKWFGDYYRSYSRPVVYTMATDGNRAFNALSEASALQPVLLGIYVAQTGEYTFSLDRNSDLSRVLEVWLYDAATATYTNLMQQDYRFSADRTDGGGRFSLSVRLLPRVSTASEQVQKGVTLTSTDRTLLVGNLPQDACLWVYDTTGKLLRQGVAHNVQYTCPVPQSGVYYVRVAANGNNTILRTIVK